MFRAAESARPVMPIDTKGGEEARSRRRIAAVRKSGAVPERWLRETPAGKG